MAILTEISMCCDGVPQKRPAGVPACCGQQSFNLDTHTCCNNELQERTMEWRMECPSTQCYDESEFICCRGSMTATNGRNMACCNYEPYDSDNYVCCDGDIVAEKVLYGDGCCAGVHYNYDEYMCCRGILNARSIGNLGYGYCCGRHAIFDTSTCCNYGYHGYYAPTPYRC